MRLEVELAQVKAMLKREVDRAEADASRSNDIIAEYKKINARLDSEQAAVKNRLLELRVSTYTSKRLFFFLFDIDFLCFRMKLLNVIRVVRGSKI